MSKRFIFVSVVFLAALVWLSMPEFKEKDDGKTTITVWESLGGPDVFIKQAGEAYSRLHPDVKIKFVNVELGDAVSQVALDAPAGVGPDIFAAPHDKLGELYNMGLVFAVENPDEVKAAVLDSCSKAVSYKGTMYGYPVSAETYALFYNKDYISEEEIPLKWSGLVNWCRDFNAKNPGKYGFMMDVGQGYYTITFASKNGNRLFGKDGTDSEHTNLNNTDAVLGMSFFQGMRKAMLDVPSADLSTATCDDSFRSGKVAMYITGLWNVKSFEEAGINFGVAALPALPGEDTPSPSFSGTRAMYVSAFSNHEKIAADFAKFLISPEMQKLRFEITGALPAIDVTVESPYIAGFLKQLDYSFPMPSIDRMSSFWASMDSASKNIWEGADVQTELNACDHIIMSN
ncbi:maltose ABC transporter substrate-binding protein [Treponema sp.]|uniref:sugar ABC transporter substrate-binding protein n=1 Tax=Treponema sp. TaxID=166 RepID=UPI0025DE2340|nr:maltose ABC transporter substrate-binding protein [Treponema sp.]MCR5217849.1 maltose ABC transporter substrate-binding protein [Treponema sp.]